jgi:hypothetical protein
VAVATLSRGNGAAGIPIRGSFKVSTATGVTPPY